MVIETYPADLNELRMAASYLRRGMTKPATFSLFVRDLPAERGFLVAAGLADALAFLTGFRFTGDDLDYLRGPLGLPADAVDALAPAALHRRRVGDPGGTDRVRWRITAGGHRAHRRGPTGRDPRG